VLNLVKLSIIIPDLKGGGAERVSINLANSFSQRGYAVDVVLLSAVGDFLADLRPEIKVFDLQVKRLRDALIPLTRYLHQNRPDATLATMWPLTVIAILARLLALSSSRMVVAEHTTWSTSAIPSSTFGRWLVRNTMRHIFPRADGIVAVSWSAADDLARFAGLDRKAITVIYNPVVGYVMPTTINPVGPYGWWSGTHKRILAVGNLSQIKDYSTLLVAFAQIRRRVNVRLLILGEGSCRTALEVQAKQLGIEGSLFMPGFTKDTLPYYKRADLHVLSSIGEGLPTVIIEALASGTPVVSTDCKSGPREILCDGKFGQLVPVGDAEALGEAIEQSLAATHDHASLVARAQDFAIDKGVNQYEALLFPRQSASDVE